MPRLGLRGKSSAWSMNTKVQTDREGLTGCPGRREQRKIGCRKSKVKRAYEIYLNTALCRSWLTLHDFCLAISALQDFGASFVLPKDKLEKWKSRNKEPPDRHVFRQLVGG